MVKVSISTYGSVNKEAGWDCKEFRLEQAMVTVEDVLRSAKLEDGKTLFDLVADKRGLKEDYTILLNGRPLQSPKDLRREIKGEDLITAMGILYPIGGG